MSNTIKTYTLAGRSSTSVNVSTRSCIQSSTNLILQFTTQIGSFTLNDNFIFSEGTIYISNPSSWGTTFVIVDLPDDVTELDVPFDTTDLPSIVKATVAAGLTYYSGTGDKLSITTKDVYPLVYDYTNKLYGRYDHINKFQYFNTMDISSDNEISFSYSASGIIQKSDYPTCLDDYMGAVVDATAIGMEVYIDNEGTDFSDYQTTEILSGWFRDYITFQVSLYSTVQISIAKSSTGIFIKHIVSLEAGTYTYSRVRKTLDDGSLLVCLPQVTNTSVLMPIAVDSQYAGINVSITPNGTFPHVTQYYSNGTTVSTTYTGGVFNLLPAQRSLITKIHFDKE